MIKNEKYRKIKKRMTSYKIAGTIVNMVEKTPAVKKDQEICGMFTVVESTLSVATLVTFFESLEKYDMSENGEELIFIKDFVLNFVLFSIIDSLALGWSLSSDEYKIKVLKKLNVPTEFINLLV